MTDFEYYSKPNILLIMTDRLAPQFLTCYGHPLVKAPTLQRLAEEGVVFDAADTNSPLCAPSRFVMMSGRLPSQIGAWDNAAEFPALRALPGASGLPDLAFRKNALFRSGPTAWFWGAPHHRCVPCRFDLAHGVR